MRKLIVVLAAMVLSASTGWAADVMVGKMVGAMPAKQYADDLKRQGLQVRLENGSPATHMREIGGIESVNPTGRVAKGREVVIRVYTAGRPVPMMNFVDSPPAEAEKFLSERGINFTKTAKLTAGPTHFGPKPECRENTIVSQSPGQGQLFNPGQTVALTVCKYGVRVASYVNMAFSSVGNTYDLKIVKTGQCTSPSSKIVKQSIPGGTVVERGTPLTIECVNEMVTVENYVGRSFAEVQPFNVSNTYPLFVRINQQKGNKVLRQSIPPGTKVPYKSEIILYFD